MNSLRAGWARIRGTKAAWPLIRGTIGTLVGVGMIVIGLEQGHEIAVVGGAFLLIVALYFTDLENVTAGAFSATARKRLVGELAEAVRARPGLRGLSNDRIDAELRLYDAILRLQSARRWDGTQVPREIEERIAQFWRIPEEIGPGEDEVDRLTSQILELVPPNRRR